MRHEGFSLVEISIVLVVVATMLAGVLPAITEGTKVRDIDTTADRMEAIQKALQAYFSTNQELPCPSDITLGVNESLGNFGVQGNGNDCRTVAVGQPIANWTDGVNVVGGGVPTKTLGLPDEYAFDGWGRRIYYHVDRRATVVGTFNTSGAITVNDGAGTPRTAAGVYALVSAGRNGHGAFTRAGGTVRLDTGSVNLDERENCQSTGTVCPGTASGYNATLVQKLEGATNPNNPTTNFDDLVTYKLRGSLLAGDAGGGDTLWTASGTNINNTNAGNVGIGNAGPTAKLQVGSGTSAGPFIGQIANTPGGDSYITSSDGTRTTFLGADSGSNSGMVGTFTNHNFSVRTNNTDRISVLAGGNVGIGTAAPDGGFRQTIDHSTGSGVNGLLTSSNIDGTIGMRLRSTGASFVDFNNTTAPVGGKFFRIGNVNGLMSFESVNDAYSAATNRMTILATGNVGIGTTGPGAKLHAVQDAATQNAIQGSYNGGGTSYYGVGASAGAYWAGLARADGYGLVTNGHIYTTSDMYYFGFLYDLSDERDKKDIKPLSSQDVLERILKIRPVSFKMKEDKKDRTELGVIAQELEKIFPELVSTADDEKGSKSVNLIGLIAPMISAIQEQHKMIEAQQKRVDILEERVKRLEESFGQLQSLTKGEDQ